MVRARRPALSLHMSERPGVGAGMRASLPRADHFVFVVVGAALAGCWSGDSCKSNNDCTIGACIDGICVAGGAAGGAADGGRAGDGGTAGGDAAGGGTAGGGTAG